ncbi:MAG: archaeal heat shock protein Hsp20 [Promethearchaeota archaeon]
MPKNNEDDEEDEENPFDFFKFFEDPNKFMIDPNKLFKDKQFKSWFREIFDKILKSFPPEFQNLSPEDIAKELMKNKSKFGFPIMYGFNINIGPDGKPTIDSFGNLQPKPYSGKPIVKSKREPLVEVNEEETKIIVIAEMPGVDRDDIELQAEDINSITISTKENANRHYYKKVELPSAINSDYAKARYRNGILEIELKKVDKKQTKIEID